MSNDATSDRRRFIDGLRELADFYEQHADVPPPPFPDFRHCILADDDEKGRAQVHAIADALGVEAVDKTDETEVRAVFGGLAWCAYYITRERSKRWSDGMAFLDKARQDGAL